MHKTEERQLGALSFCALSVPAILYLSQVGWLWASAVTALLYLLLRFGRRAEGEALELPLWLRLLIGAWNSLMIAILAGEVSRVYGGEVLLPAFVLILLAVYGSERNVLLRVASVILFFLAGIYGVLFSFSIPELDLGELQAIKEDVWHLLPWGLLPGILLYMYPGGEMRPSRGGVLAGGVLAILASLVADGMGAKDFYTASMSVNILGTMERLEPLVAAALTAGAFCALGALSGANRKLFERRKDSRWMSFEVIQFLCAGLLCFLREEIPAWVIALGATIFWGLIPLVLQWVVPKEKLKKI